LANIARKARRTLAISTVIGTVLMTTLTITLGVMVVFWASQSFGLYQGSAGIYFNNRAAALRESMAVEDIWFYYAATSSCGASVPSGTYQCINITVRNTGAIEVKIVAIYINSTSKTPLPLNPPVLPYTMTVGSPKTFMIQYSTGSWGTTKAYFIQVASARGNQVNAYWGYP
jgi:hypothetical protein